MSVTNTQSFNNEEGMNNIITNDTNENDFNGNSRTILFATGIFSILLKLNLLVKSQQVK